MEATTETILNNVIFVPLDRTIDNHDQAGEIDEAKVVEIAESLQMNANNGMKGLLQVPIARLTDDGKYELAFGRHRRAAFIHLMIRGEKFFEHMPLIVRDLDDLQMFEALATENFKRRDINPIEAAEILHAYMTKYHKTSVEAAEFFHKTEEYVRGTVRLLNLTDPAKELLRAGEINVTTARAVLTVQKIADKDSMEMLIGDLRDKAIEPEDAITNVLRADAVDLSSARDWRDNKKFPVKYLAPLTEKSVSELLDMKQFDDFNYGARQDRKRELKQIMQLIASGMEVADEQFPHFQIDRLEKIRILANPPACTACPMHVQADGSHYCGMKMCYERKSRAWQQAEATKLVKEIGIPLYVNEQTDGKAVELSRWNDADQKLFEERHADLRLRPTTRSVWNNFKGLPNNVVLLAVGKTAEKRIKAEQKTVEKRETEQMNHQLESALRQVKDQAINRFLYHVVVPAFESLLDGMTNLPLTLFIFEELILERADFPEGVDSREEQLDQIRNSKKKADALKQLRRLMILEVLDGALGWDSYYQYQGAKQVVMVMAKKARERAEEWGVKLPKDFASQAEIYQAGFDKEVKALGKA